MPRGQKAKPPVMDYDAPAAAEQENKIPPAQMNIPGTPEPELPELQPERTRRARNPEAAPIKRMSLTLNQDDSIAWDRLRESNKEEVKKIVTGWMADPKMLASLGIEKPAIRIFDESWCDTIYDTVGNLEVMLAPKMFGVTLEQAAILRYTSAEKDSLREPTAKVINKYLPAWLARFEDEIKLAMLLVSISFVKVQMLRAIAMMPKQKPNGAEQKPPASVDPNFMQEPAAA